MVLCLAQVVLSILKDDCIITHLQLLVFIVKNAQ